MIKEAKIINFQSHVETTLKFHNGMNVIIGRSDSGKTAILRALNLVINNKPSGDSFRSNWGGDTIVRLHTETNIITRAKTKTKNLYQLNTTKFNAFGTAVPDEIQKALNFADVNLQQQLDSPFLISETSGNVAAYFNKIANLEIIDKGLQNVQKEINTITQTIKTTSQIIEDKKLQLKEFIDLDTFENDLISIERLELKKNGIIQDITSIEDYIIEFEKLQKEKKLMDEIISSEKDIDIILKLYSERKEAKQNAGALSNLIHSIKYIKKLTKNAENVIEAENDINIILKLYKEAQNQAILTNKLHKLCYSITSIQINIKTASSTLIELEKEFKKSFPKICPLCETKIK